MIRFGLSVHFQTSALPVQSRLVVPFRDDLFICVVVGFAPDAIKSNRFQRCKNRPFFKLFANAVVLFMNQRVNRFHILRNAVQFNRVNRRLPFAVLQSVQDKRDALISDVHSNPTAFQTFMVYCNHNLITKIPNHYNPSNLAYELYFFEILELV